MEKTDEPSFEVYNWFALTYKQLRRFSWSNLVISLK